MAMLGIAVILTIDPASVPHNDGFWTIDLSAGTLRTLFAIGAAIRMLALYANGHWPIYGPRMRAACALFGAVVWAEMAAALVVDRGHLSVDVATYTALTIGELYSSYRAAGDGRAFRRA